VLNVACLGILSSLATIAVEVITSQSRALPTTERARREQGGTRIAIRA
jgi:hypothetical protein